MYIDESLANLIKVCEKFHKTVVSFGKTMTALYVVLFRSGPGFFPRLEVGKTHVP